MKYPVNYTDSIIALLSGQPATRSCDKCGDRFALSDVQQTAESINLCRDCASDLDAIPASCQTSIRCWLMGNVC